MSRFLGIQALGLFVLLALLPTHVESAPVYGRNALGGLREYGVAVRVVCTGDLQQHQQAFKDHVENRLRSREIQIAPAGSVTLKLVVNSIRSDDGFFVVHMALNLDQTAFLASNNTMTDATTWDAWKMGEYREEDLLQEVDDLSRQFINDYIAAN